MDVTPRAQGDAVDVEPFLRLFVAAILTALIGLDREARAKPAGLRTNMVVGIATAAFAYVGVESFDGGDPTRVASQIVSGIGFLGGGAIFASAGKPRGLTTAAALWGSAAVGLASGVGALSVAVAVVVVTVLALTPLDTIAEKLLADRVRQDARVQVHLADLASVVEVRAAALTHAASLHRMDLTEVGGQTVADLRVSGRREELERLVREVESIDGVIAVLDSGTVELDR